jgi:hypothetical protein
MAGSTKQSDLVACSIGAAYRSNLSSSALTEQLLTSGGDARIVPNSTNRQNKYGCPATPEPEVLAFGSSTASTISPKSFDAANRLHSRLNRAAHTEIPSTTYARELARIRSELLDLCGLSDLLGLEVIFAASGTDIHLIAGQLAGDVTSSDLMIVMIDPAETGSGVPAALGGHHFSDCAALGGKVRPDAAIFGAAVAEVFTVACRGDDGSLRTAHAVDAEVEALVVDAIAAGRRVLLNLVDVSKTGIIAPSVGCAMELRKRFPVAVEVLVDACQFRLAPSTLRAYLENGFWVAITGSKFVGGPAFSGVLLLPSAAARTLRTHILSPALGAYSARADWPQGWMGRHSLTDTANYGLLLRWEAAIAELRSFRTLSEVAIADFLEIFAEAIHRRLTADSSFRPLPVPKLDRHAVTNCSSWDLIPTIFPFILCRPTNSERRLAPLNREETARVHKLLACNDVGMSGTYLSPTTGPIISRRCQLGQPVRCGTFQNVPVSALRLCASVRLIVDAISPQGRGAKTVIAEALLALDKCALLTKAIDQ